MKKSEYYYKARFSPKIIRSAHKLFLSSLDQTKKIETPEYLEIRKGTGEWSHDSIEEFMVEYQKADSFRFFHIKQGKYFLVSGDKHYTHVEVKSDSKKNIESVFEIFENNLDESIIKSENIPAKIFIGHGRDPQWRDLKDHLHEKHGFEVIAYEIGPRAGTSVKEVLESMLNESSFAFLVLTGEDQSVDGKVHARENVIHELGLFQGRLGFTKAIAILEEGVHEFSNILGINQIRFSKGNIKETFGEILAIIKREIEMGG